MNASESILVVDDESAISELIKEILEDEGYDVDVAADAREARAARRGRRYDLILLDIWMPDEDGITLLGQWRDRGELSAPVVMMSGHGTIDTAVEATRLGAQDFLEKPLSMAKLLVTVRNALDSARLRREVQGLATEVDVVREPAGRSRTMQALREELKRLSQHDTPILLHGEAGSGKQVCARYLHQQSARADGPFVRLPAGASQQRGADAELFGAENGDEVRYGLLEEAAGGVLFIEEIADLDEAVQGRLYRAFHENRFVRRNGTDPVALNVRVVAATSHAQGALLDSQRVRKDLFYLLNTVTLTVPPLREHREDVPELLGLYMDKLAGDDSLPYRRFTVGAQNRLRNHGWPGNVRELKNLVQRLLILGSGADIDQAEVEAIIGEREAPDTGGGDDDVPLGFDLPLKEARELFERSYLIHHIRASGGSVSAVAHIAGLERTHLYRKLRSLNIDPKRVSPARDSATDGGGADRGDEAGDKRAPDSPQPS